MSKPASVVVLNVTAVHDAGRIVNPLSAHSQVNGGILMGIGFALFGAELRGLSA